MRRLGLALSVAVLAVGTAAHAQISNIDSDAGSTLFTAAAGSQPLPYGAGVTPGGPPGASFNSFVDVGKTAITFESSDAGSRANINSFSTVSFDVNNNTGAPATLKSTITGAGLGFYLANTSGGCLYTGCPQAVGYTFSQLATGNATVGFNFSITQSGPGVETSTLYQLSGSLQMNFDGSLNLFDDLGSFPDTPGGTGSGARSLTNFGDALGNDFAGNIGATSALGYVWDATGISVDLGDLETQTVTYRTSVFSNSTMPCIPGTMICLVAYSGFGDPVGRGGGVENLTAGHARSLDSFARLGGSQDAGGLIGGIHFGATTFDIPVFNNGVVTFGAQQDTGVPEPATWATLILGFGLLGATLRRRRTVAAI